MFEATVTGMFVEASVLPKVSEIFLTVTVPLPENPLTVNIAPCLLISTAGFLESTVNRLLHQRKPVIVPEETE
jgi:hypothetical protein